MSETKASLAGLVDVRGHLQAVVIACPHGSTEQLNAMAALSECCGRICQLELALREGGDSE